MAEKIERIQKTHQKMVEAEKKAKKEIVKLAKAAEGKDTAEKILAVVLIRGMVGLSRPIKDTLLMLRLRRKNHCVIVKNTPSNKGMVLKVKDYVTWGEISEEILKDLLNKRGREHKSRLTDKKKKYSYKALKKDGKNYIPVFSLNPPRKGFGRKGIKVSFKTGGGLGYRGEKINDLISRMLD